jgi:hypothetical protein
MPVPDDGSVHNPKHWDFWIRKILSENTVVVGGPLFNLDASQRHVSP